MPHIYASNHESLWYGLGWSQAANHSDLLLRLYGESRGRASEYWGIEGLPTDAWVHRMGIPERSEQWLGQMKPQFRRLLESFAQGINDYADSNLDRVHHEFHRVLPVTPADVLAHFQRVIHFTFVAPVPGIVERLGPPWNVIPLPHAALTRHGSKHPTAFKTNEWDVPGSNAWALAPKRTSKGHAVLLCNPHLPWSDLYTWHEAHLVGPRFNLYGASLVGFPFLAMGFTDHLGWTHTVNTMDGADLYQVTEAEGGYRFDGIVRPYETKQVTLKVRQSDETLTDFNMIVKQTVHGPVVATRPGFAMALRVTGLDAPDALEQYFQMAAAKNLREFESAHAMLQMPLFTTMYADRDGHVMHLFGGRTPVRNGGDWATWSRPVSGDSSDNLWTRAHTYDELPKALNPASGWLQNANDPPWTTTLPAALNPEDYPAYIAPRWSGPTVQFRAQRSTRLLLEAGEKMTLEEVMIAKHSTRVEMADRLLDDLQRAVESNGDEVSREAMRVLDDWDRHTDAQSRGAVLFLEWVKRTGFGAFAIPGTPDQPLTTPDGLAQPQRAVAALVSAARHVKEKHGSLDVAWGDVHRIRDGRGLDLPSNGGPGALGIFRNVEYQPDTDGRFRAMGGDSFVMAVEMSQPPRAFALLPSGNATQPSARTPGDQFVLFADKRLRPVWRTRAEVEANLAYRETWR